MVFAMKTVNLHNEQDRRLVEHAAQVAAPRCRLNNAFIFGEILFAMKVEAGNQPGQIGLTRWHREPMSGNEQ